MADAFSIDGDHTNWKQNKTITAFPSKFPIKTE